MEGEQHNIRAETFELDMDKILQGLYSQTFLEIQYLQSIYFHSYYWSLPFQPMEFQWLFFQRP